MRKLLYLQNSENHRGYFFLLLFLAFAAAVIGDNATEALLLSKFDASLVSRLFAINAILLFLFSIFAMSIVDKFNRAKLYFLFLTLYSLTIIISRFLVEFNLPWLYLFMYSLAYTGKILMFFFVWTLANDVADSRSGARDFPIIAAGGTIGAIGATFLIPQMLTVVAPENLLILWIIPLLISTILLSVMIYRFGFLFSRKRFGRYISITPKALIDNLLHIRRGPVISRLALAYFIIFFLIFNQQFLFYQAIKVKFSDARSISHFLGYFNGIALLMTLFLQTTVAGPISRRLGSMRTLFLLPLILAIAFLLLLVGPTSYGSLFVSGIIAGVALRIAFFDSFFSPNYQNIFSNLPDSVRGKSKLAIDGVVKPAAMIFSAIWISFVGSHFANYALLFALSLFTLTVLIRLKESYVTSLIQLLSGYTTEHDGDVIKAQAHNLNSPVGINYLYDILCDESSQLKQIAVAILVEIDSDEAVSDLYMMFLDGDNWLKSVIVKALEKSSNKSVLPFLETVISEPHDSRVIADTIWSLGEIGGGEPNIFINALESLNARIRGNGAVILASRGELDEAKIETVVMDMLRSQMEEYISTGLWYVSQMSVGTTLRAQVKELWHTSFARITGNDSLWRSYTKAVISLEELHLLAEMLDAIPVVNELKQQLIRDEIVIACHKIHMHRFLELRTIMSSYSFFTILNALAISGVKPSEREKYEILEFAKDEFRSGVIGRGATSVLWPAKTSGEDFLRSAIEDEEITLHINSLILYASISDRTGKIHRVMSRINSHQHGVRAQVLEIVDSLKQSPINRLLVDFLENKSLKKSYFNSRKEVVVHYLNSPITSVQRIAHYVFEKEEIDG